MNFVIMQCKNNVIWTRLEHRSCWLRNLESHIVVNSFLKTTPRAFVQTHGIARFSTASTAFLHRETIVFLTLIYISKIYSGTMFCLRYFSLTSLGNNLNFPITLRHILLPQLHFIFQESSRAIIVE